MLFAIHAGGLVVLDSQHNLQWYDSEEQFIEKWKLANLYCSELNVNGYDDWRLPSEAELVRFAKNQALKKRFVNLWDEVFWTDDNGIFNATTVYSGNGFVTSSDNCEKYATICVRTVK